MAMFRYKRKTALKYSKTLSDHFNIGIKVNITILEKWSSDELCVGLYAVQVDNALC